MPTAYAYPTIVSEGDDSSSHSGSGTFTSTLNSGTLLLGSATGGLVVNGGGTGNITRVNSRFVKLSIWAQWEGFALPSLPADAVIKGIYGVVTCSFAYDTPYTNPRADFGTMGVPVAYHPTTISLDIGAPYTSHQFISGNLGTDLSLITSAKPWVASYQSLYENSINGVLDIESLSYMIDYEGSPALVIPHGVNCHAYDNGGFQSPTFPPGNGLLIGDLTPARNWARANNIHGALAQETQVPAIQLLEMLGKVNNSAWVYSGDTLKLIPWDEVSAAGWGARYDATTAGGPSYDFTDADYADGEGPVLAESDSPINCDNVVAVEYKNRKLDYSTSTISGNDPMGIALFGTRKGGTLDSSPIGVGVAKGAQSFPAIHDPAVAQAISSILVKRSAANPQVYKFRLRAEHFFREAMDFVTISDGPLGLSKKPVRLLSAKENGDRTLDCMAEEFIYGLHHPDTKEAMEATGTLVSSNVDPGVVNTPVIFEPTQGMLGSGAKPQLWIVVSGEDQNYGGCIGYVSVDGGSSYPQSLGSLAPGTTGYSTSSFSTGADPDTTNLLSVDLSESAGELTAASQAIADGFLDQCYVGMNSSPAVTDYEVVCPTAATATALNEYDLGTYIRRGVKDTAILSHASGSRFAALDGAVLKIDIDPTWFGQTIWFKFAAINLQGGQQNALADCVPYSYTIAGIDSIATFLVNGA